MKKQKEITVVNWINIDGTDYKMDNLPKEKQMEISEKLAIQMMESLGYAPVKPETA